MLDLEASSVTFFIIFNSILIVVGYNFWNHFPREGGKYRNSQYYANMKTFEPVIEDRKVDNSLDLSSAGKLLSSCVQHGLDSRSG
ncbi:hypothetical protein PRIPAC_89854 [Pristionchus pacificus]|uniref:Uncharacterized protein n=1 Tax=Pristionchus pacificus TaxID=54126 RepID=A0A2A6CTI0_PRIPA|nr:hypothetical protein PRIPAC_89854 [Pristionchus pacificus]|eukprot:PDM81396.1 hypothetical protein PRIPAC_35272 [Pristionchus pacificus]